MQTGKKFAKLQEHNRKSKKAKEIIKTEDHPSVCTQEKEEVQITQKPEERESLKVTGKKVQTPIDEKEIESTSNRAGKEGNFSHDDEEQKKSEIHYDRESASAQNEESIQRFFFNNFGEEVIVEVIGKKIVCISCLKMFARINLHFANLQSVVQI